jgi:hypothetical protein
VLIAAEPQNFAPDFQKEEKRTRCGISDDFLACGDRLPAAATALSADDAVIAPSRVDRVEMSATAVPANQPYV